MKTLLLLFSLLFSILSSQLPEINTPLLTFEADIGKSLTQLTQEHPQAKLFVRNDGYPDAAALCLGEEQDPFSYLMGATQGHDLWAAAENCGDQLLCYGVMTTTGYLFPHASDVIPFSDFFSPLGIADYDYFEESGPAQGWLTFSLSGKTVWINTNCPNGDGGWDYTGQQEIPSTAPTLLIDEELEGLNALLIERF